MNKISTDKKVAVIAALVEGNSIRSTSRMTGVAKGTILRLLAEVGTACAQYLDVTVRNFKAERIQIDEIWSFVGCKEKHATPEKKAAGMGDAWTFTAIEARTKLVISWMVGARDAGFAQMFLEDVASRVSTRVQVTTDGHKMYLTPVVDAFGGAVDYAQLVKIYGTDPEGQKRYSPARILGIETNIVWGDPDPKHISTSYVERQNLNMRMNMRRFTRLTNAFSKSLDNHCHMLAIFHMHHNFVRIHQSLRVTPAMESGITTRLWSLYDVVGLTEKAHRSLAA
jgi:IS1 family transposase